MLGDNVEQGAQVVTVNLARDPKLAWSSVALKEELRRHVRFTPANYCKITSISVLSRTFNEWVALPPVLREGETLVSGDRIHVYCEAHVDASVDVLFYEVFLESLLFPTRSDGNSTISNDASEVRQKLRDSLASFKARGGTAAVAVADLREPTSLISTSRAACLNLIKGLPAAARYKDVETTDLLLSQAAPTQQTGPRKAARVPASAAQSQPLSARSTTAAEATDYRTVAMTRPNKAAPPIASNADVETQPSAAPAAASVNNSVSSVTGYTAQSIASGSLTIYCVYTGTTCQRAKAFRVDRSCVTLDQLLTPLRQKFHADLALGFIAADGACVELTSDDALRGIIQAVPASQPSVTLHCWAAAAVTFDEGQQSTVASAVRMGSGPGSVVSDTASVASSRKSTRPSSAAPQPAGSSQNRPNKSSRPTSAMSVRSNASVRGSGTPLKRAKPSVTPSHALDVSGVAWNQDQLREMFDQVDTDGSGLLSKEEFYRYMTQTYDSMGIPDFNRKIASMIRDQPEFSDGCLGFEEFSVLMLKIAQW